MIKMKTFKKLMGLLLATSLTTGLMVGCGSNKSTGDSGETNESEEATSDSSEEEPTVVTVGDENGTEFASKEYYDPSDMEGNIAKAKELLKEAGYENGNGIPTIELMYNSEGAHKDICQIIQQNWEEIGVNVELTNQEWAVFLNTRQQGGYEIARQGWIGDYSDPMTFLDMWVTGRGNNDCGFSNSEYDSLIAEAKVETDTKKREELLRQAEDILMDEMPVIPVYFYTTVMAWNDDVEGVLVTALGKVYFKNAYKIAK